MLVRPYRVDDEPAAIAAWHAAWAKAYPAIDFAARLAWWRERWRRDLVPSCAIFVAEAGTGLVGFVTVDPATGYLDQIVVAPDHWRAGVGAALLQAAREASPSGLELQVNDDNDRAIGFYRREGFHEVGESSNPNSGARTLIMRWRPDRRQQSAEG